MNQSSAGAVPKSALRKLVLQMLVGAASGAAVTFLALRFFGSSGLDLHDPSRASALGIGLVFLVMGAFVLIGVALPGAGSRLLNVEDAEELREQRGALWPSAIVIMAIGGLMGALALAGGSDWAGMISRQTAAVVLAVVLVAATILSIMVNKGHDELMRSVAQEGAAWGFYASMAIFVVWGGLAHLGYVAWITPLGMVSALMAIMLLAVFIVCGVRGLLMPR